MIKSRKNPAASSTTDTSSVLEAGTSPNTSYTLIVKDLNGDGNDKVVVADKNDQGRAKVYVIDPSNLPNHPSFS